MVNLEQLPRDEEDYLGWHLENRPDVGGTYTCFAWPGDDEAGFTVTLVTEGTEESQEARFEASRTMGLALTRAKVFLGAWQPNAEYAVELPRRNRVPTPLIRRLLLTGLHRLYEAGLGKGDFQVDLHGVALELGVPDQVVVQAVDFLYDNSLIEQPDTLDKHRSFGDFSLTHDGAEYLESTGIGTETFLQELYRSTLARLFSLSSALAEAFESLRDDAGSNGVTRQDLVGFASKVRDFVQELTDHLYGQLSAPPLSREETINKVRAITAGARSETRAHHVKALAEVVETHWKRLNKVQQKAVHDGTVESQRLFAYVLLFVADLLDTATGD